jgi:hypothetical protein
MDTNTLLIILVVIFLFGGFGFYGRGRWFWTNATERTRLLVAEHPPAVRCNGNTWVSAIDSFAACRDAGDQHPSPDLMIVTAAPTISTTGNARGQESGGAQGGEVALGDVKVGAKVIWRIVSVLDRDAATNVTSG